MRTNQKKLNVLVIILVLITLVGIVALAGCGSPRKFASKVYENDTDLAKNATFKSGDNAMKNFSLKGKDGEKNSVIVDLGKPTRFNTIGLEEKGESVTSFKISASNTNDASSFKTIYEGDTIEAYRGCFIEDAEYRFLNVEVANSTGKYNVNNIKVYNKINENNRKRVASYFLLDRINDASLDALETVTEIILFTFTRFDKDGNVCYCYNDLPNAEVKEMFSTNLAKLREKVKEIEGKQNRKINIFATILMPWSDDPDDANKYSRAIMEPSRVKTTAKNVAAFLNEYNLDGVDFDYEYPYKRNEYKLFEDFLFAVHDAIGDRLLSTALGAWNIKMSKKAIDILDQVNLMTYDIFDSHGYHGAFSSCMLRDLDTTIGKNIPAEKINVGVPFYSRPLNKAGFWGDYFRFYNEGLIKSRYTNLIENYPAIDSGGNKITEHEYLNGYQMIQDKMAFIIDSPVAGIMMWHYHCDIDYSNDLSLFRAISETLRLKKAGLNTNK